MNRKPIINVIMILCGTALLILAIFVFNDDSVKQIAGLCYGFGAMSAALGIGGFLDRKLVSSVETKELKKRKKELFSQFLIVSHVFFNFNLYTERQSLPLSASSPRGHVLVPGTRICPRN